MLNYVCTQVVNYSKLWDPFCNKVYFDPQNVVLGVLVASIIIKILKIIILATKTSNTTFYGSKYILL